MLCNLFQILRAVTPIVDWKKIILGTGCDLDKQNCVEVGAVGKEKLSQLANAADIGPSSEPVVLVHVVPMEPLLRSGNWFVLESKLQAQQEEVENGFNVPIRRFGRRESLFSPFSNPAAQSLSFQISFSSLLQVACFCAGNRGFSEASPQRCRLRSSHIEHSR
ncbi:hypothetical protein KFK09_009343 [Dendrobium nobile]|uniref:Uncharacterized protein n=1 Tax=Dendrobium nobile TaxID=94219 RepID=A0A8T3BS43_DENNO|nr:hypothetical protein KFK09_009343 [Dendrobium nobile]